MKVAIVGTSKLTENESIEAIQIIEGLLSIDDILISGGANGIDSIAETVSNYLEIPKQIHYPPSNNWTGFKERNIIIADSCDKLYCITTAENTEKCYHCQENHDRTGGCWTMKYAKRLGKPTQLIIIPKEKDCCGNSAIICSNGMVNFESLISILFDPLLIQR